MEKDANKKEIKEFTCCFCGKHEIGEGHDVFPADRDRTKRCCAKCHETIVKPALIRSYLA